MITMTLKGPVGIKQLSQLPETLKNTLFQGMQDGGNLIVATSQKKYLSGPYPIMLAPRSGLLRLGISSIAGLSGVPGEFGRIIVKSGRWYGKVHEQFGAPFIIYAKNVPYMRFFWEQRGVWVRAKQVIIPPRPFLWPAVLDCVDKIRNLLDKMIVKAYKTAGKGTP